jgi:hypothetical protein
LFFRYPTANIVLVRFSTTGFAGSATESGERGEGHSAEYRWFVLNEWLLDFALFRAYYPRTALLYLFYGRPAAMVGTAEVRAVEPGAVSGSAYAPPSMDPRDGYNAAFHDLLSSKSCVYNAQLPHAYAWGFATISSRVRRETVFGMDWCGAAPRI